MANGKAVKPAEYKRVKGLIEFGVPAREIKKLTKLSEGTIWFIRKSKDMADYHKIRSSYYKPKEVKQTSLEDRVKALEARVSWLESEARKQPEPINKKSSRLFHF